MTTAVTTTREIHLAQRPKGWPTPDDFRLVETELPALDDGQILVRNLVMSVDPYMRGRMNDVKSYVPAYALDAPLDGGAVGEVVESRSEQVPVGTTVLHNQGWREHAVVDARRVQPVDTDLAPASAYLGILGMPGLTAYAGLVRIGGFQPGETVFVSGAAGAVGSAVGQFARLLGATRVVGSAGSPEKVAYLRDELGFDAAFDYHDGDIAGQLAKAAPDGIDVYFDNVGGDHLDAAIRRLNTHGRAALCGAISQYNDTEASPGPRNLFQAVGKRLRLQGFIVSDHNDLQPEFVERVGPWLASGELTYKETFADGIDNAPDAFLGLLRGDNVGKMVVRLG